MHLLHSVVAVQFWSHLYAFPAHLRPLELQGFLCPALAALCCGKVRTADVSSFNRYPSRNSKRLSFPTFFFKSLFRGAVLFQLRGSGLHGTHHTFEKPWFTTWESALACWISIIIFWALHGFPHARRPPASRSEAEPLLGAAEQEEAVQQSHPFAEASFQALFLNLTACMVVMS